MDLRGCCRVRGLDENLERGYHVSVRNRRYSRWDPGRPSFNGSLRHSGMASDDGKWFDDPYRAFIKEKGNELFHYGISGQKWGVITKEYQPVAVDHRKTGNNGSVYQKAKAGIRNRIAEERMAGQKEYYDTLAYKQAKREKRNRAIRKGGIALGIGVLGIAALSGLKLSKIRPSSTYKNALRSLTQLKPTKARLGKAATEGFTLMSAREQNRNAGLSRVLGTFKRAGNIVSMSRYREKIKKARGYIDKLKSYRLRG